MTQKSEVNHRIVFSIGTNSHRLRNMRMAKTELVKLFGEDFVLTRVVETDAIGFEGSRFLNSLAECRSSLPLQTIEKELKRIEKECGNTHEKRCQGIVEMDIDILEYGGERHHVNDWKRSYVIELYGELVENATINHT